MFITNEHVGDRSRLEDWRGMYEKLKRQNGYSYLLLYPHIYIKPQL